MGRHPYSVPGFCWAGKDGVWVGRFDEEERLAYGYSKSTSNNMLPKAVMEGSRSNATKESINEDNSLSKMVKNVEYHSTLANLKSILGQGGTSIYLL
ncbi:hypothetical protein Tco_0876065 [Tanacetum coccineum]|uniref:Uncharacterized protein n=1 Tax=Tanacetum coccineum TaxID=301880 RepID=A0ABQ5BSV9_9ASTR